MTLTGRASMPSDLSKSLVSLSISRGSSGLAARADTSGTYLRSISTSTVKISLRKRQKMGRVERYSLILSLPLLLLQTERDTADWTLGDTLHKMRSDCEGLRVSSTGISRFPANDKPCAATQRSE